MKEKLEKILSAGLQAGSKRSDDSLDVFGQGNYIFSYLDDNLEPSFELSDGTEILEDDEVYVYVDKKELTLDRMNYVDFDHSSGTYDLFFDFGEKVGVWLEGVNPEDDFDDLEITDDWFHDNFNWVEEQIQTADSSSFRIDY